MFSYTGVVGVFADVVGVVALSTKNGGVFKVNMSSATEHKKIIFKSGDCVLHHLGPPPANS